METDLDVISFQHVDSNIPKWQTFKTSEVGAKLDQSTCDIEMYADIYSGDEQFLIITLLRETKIP
jgi:hypothetical protein